MQEIKLDFNQDRPKNKKKTTLIVVIGVAVLFAVIMAIAFGVLSGGSTGASYLTYSNYAQIQNGMSYYQVVDILDGNQGALSTSSGFGGYTLAYYTWSNSSGTKCIVVGFENGSVCAKSQYGLR